MASGYKNGGGASRTVSSEQTGEESSESDGETEPAKSFHRRLSTNREIKCAVSFVCRICIYHFPAGSVLWLELKRRGLCLHTTGFVTLPVCRLRFTFYNTSLHCMHPLFGIACKTVC